MQFLKTTWVINYKNVLKPKGLLLVLILASRPILLFLGPFLSQRLHVSVLSLLF